jgi:hypothetical protein
MIQKIKKHLVALSTLILMVVPLAVPMAVASAANTINPGSEACGGVGGSLTASGTCTSSTGGSTSGIQKFLDWAINLFSAIVGIIAVVMVIVGGLKYITSGGDSNKVGSAKNTLLYAIIGLIIVVMAQIIIHFVIHEVNSNTTGL